MKKSSLICLILLLAVSACKDDPVLPEPTDPVLIVENQTFTEANENSIVRFTVQMAGTIETNIVVQYETENGTAEKSADYVEIKDQTIVFSASQTEQEVEVELIGDVLEETAETFTIRFFSPSSNSFPEKTVTITIENDDNTIADIVIPDGYSTPATYAGMELVWSDEFQSDALNEADWTYELGNGCPNLCGWGNEERQFYQKDNVYFKDQEYLIIQARREQVTSNAFTSARIKTEGKQSFKYGRIDIRAVLPEGQGLWPALWLLGDNVGTVGWPACGEIDLMELVGNVPSRVHGTVHFGVNNDDRDSKGDTHTLPLGRKYAENFHVFSLDWQEDEIKMYVDDELYLSVDPSDVGAYNYPFNESFFFIFNVAVGGDWPGPPNSSTVFPQHMIVDYVRVFQ